MKVPRWSAAVGPVFLVLATLPLLVSIAPAASAADIAAPSPVQLALDGIKPAVVRIETTDSADLTVGDLIADQPAIAGYVRNRLSALAASGRRFASVTDAVQAVAPDFLADLAAHPATYFHLTGARSDSQSETMSLVGSGVIVDKAGYVLSTSVVVPDRASAVTALGRTALAREAAKLKADAIGDLAQFTADQRGKLGQILADFLLPTVQAESFKQVVAVFVGPSRPGKSADPGVSQSAEVVRTLAVGPAAVAVLKVGSSTVPSVGLPSGPDVVAGSAVTVVGYPSPAADGTGLDPTAAIAPTATEGTVGGPASSLLTTTAAFSPGAVGGPVMAADGSVVGLAVQVDAGRAVIPVSQLRQAVSSTPVHAATSSDMAAWQAAARDLSKQWYKKARARLETVTRADPKFPYAATALSTTRQAILDGKDRSPKDRPVVAGIIAGALLLVVVAATVVVGAGSGRRKKPAPGWQPAGW